MRQVVDSNYLQADALREYLARSPTNFVVLTDYAAMEAYKGDTLASIFRSMAILSEFPKQAIILKNTLIVCGLNARGAGLQRRLIDRRHTADFGIYCRHLKQAERGDKYLEHELLEKGKEATAHMQRILEDATNFPDALEALTENYTDAELKALRTRRAHGDEMVEKFIKNTCTIAIMAFAKHPRVKKIPTGPEAVNTFIFRYSLCYHLMALRWIMEGGAKGAKVEKIRNDIVDANFAAYATFFDGLLTADKKLQGIYEEMRFVLDEYQRG